jgi:hypothetical protein
MEDGRNEMKHLVERERLTEVKGTLLVVVRFEETSRENVGSTNFESMMER